MHEVDMTKCLLLSLNEWKAQHQPNEPEVSVVHLEVGTFTCVEPDALVFTFGAAVQGSWLAGSELRIETVPLRARCVRCESLYTPEQENAYRSPCCDHPMEEIVSGRELRIRSIDYVFSNQALPVLSP
ncbi:hydrogenase maturation nickel metallochaperone HypA [Cyanobium sp. ATX 6F1]|uniref:hydrogenase maturation nickel metallochaperone HypA/HybF n=1 Tax=unclassified Cyanobium TaxID=2627006 RepID=UPI0020CD4A79|nr:hydrogenase maturation nickel metallochaperone HypA [Cyanobium sp. ATX 6F1]MCP9915968.1 hydrogenase maturation nickel metallochaperone HypA [Cyanobium sp. ATX 6F1]